MLFPELELGMVLRSVKGDMHAQAFLCLGRDSDGFVGMYSYHTNLFTCLRNPNWKYEIISRISPALVKILYGEKVNG